jgi:hypothetical protein
VERLVAACTSVGVRLTLIGEVTDRNGRCTLRAGGDESELPVYESDEVARALSGATDSSTR